MGGARFPASPKARAGYGRSGAVAAAFPAMPGSIPGQIQAVSSLPVLALRNIEGEWNAAAAGRRAALNCLGIFLRDRLWTQGDTSPASVVYPLDVTLPLQEGVSNDSVTGESATSPTKRSSLQHGPVPASPLAVPNKSDPLRRLQRRFPRFQRLRQEHGPVIWRVSAIRAGPRLFA